MVEMNEVAQILRYATKDSLIILDEVGRGTSTFDGMSIAKSVMEYIHGKIKAKTLFATHYHELTDLEEILKNLKNIHVSAYEEEGKLVFLHKIKEGSVDKSYGIHVAKLALLPDEVIKRADEILKVYEGAEKKRDIKVQEALPLDELIKEKSKIEEEIEKINPLEITPIQALNIIYNLKQMLK